jgi:lactobin A/cerein 7B family class IIb bacteriocin
MNTLNLNAYGVSEMNKQEMVETDGGSFLLGLGIGIIIGAIICALFMDKEVNIEISAC